jgi:site-specific DNA recombinase
VRRVLVCDDARVFASCQGLKHQRAQRQLCRAKAEGLGATIAKEFVEPGNSAQTIEKRPVFRELLAYLSDDPGIDYVVIYMRSRAFRNLADGVLTKRRLERMHIKLVSAKEDFGDGIMADAMEAVTDIINEVQVRMSGEDIRVKMRHKAENGGTLGRARLGYRNTRVEHDGRLVNTVGVDEERAPLVRMAWELYASGEYSIERLYETMADRGLTTRPSRRSPAQPLAASQLHRMLSDPYYTGVVVYKGEIYPGRHPAIVSRELFDRVQQVLSARSSRGQRDRILFHYLKGLLFCERCHKAGRTSRMVYVEARGRSGTRHPYYLCRGRQDKLCDLPYLPVALVERAIVNFYPSLQLSSDFVVEATGVIEETMADEQRVVRDMHANFRKQLKDLDVREERLLDLAADDSLPRAKIRARLRRVQTERAEAESGLHETSDQLRVGAERLTSYLRLLEDVGKLYRNAPDKARRLLNDALLERLFIDEHGVEDGILSEPLVELRAAQDAYATARHLTGSDRPETLEPLRDPQLGRWIRRTLDERSSSHRKVASLSDHWVSGSSKAIMVEVLRRYSRQTYQEKALRNITRILDSEPARRAEDAQIGHVHRIDVRCDATVLESLVAEYEAGASTVQLQELFGLGKGSVLAILHAAGVKIRRQPMDDEQLEEIKQLYQSGLTIREVAASLSMPKTTVQDALGRLGQAMRPAARRRRGDAQV